MIFSTICTRECRLGKGKNSIFCLTSPNIFHSLFKSKKYFYMKCMITLVILINELRNSYYLFSELAVILWSDETKFGEGKMGAFWYTTVGWGWLNGMKYSTMPWQVSGSRRTATHFCVETRFMTVGMVESVSSVGGRVSSHQYWEICKTVRIYDY